VIEEIARGCEYLYNKGILHRDIKTENILLTENSNPWTISRCGEDLGFWVCEDDRRLGDEE
jgi:serine/threonine protein kinase